MLSGNVAVDFNGAALRLTGDADSNDVKVEVDRFSGYVNVIGNNGTTFYGQSMLQFAAPGIKRIVANMGGGDDVLEIDCADQPDMPLGPLVDASIDMGSGDDTFDIRDLEFTSWVTLSGGDGDDMFAVTNIETGHNLRVRGQSGDDTIKTSDNTVNRNMILSGGKDVDYVSVDGDFVAGTARIRAGSNTAAAIVDGLETGGDLYFNGSNDPDAFNIFDSTIGVNLNINGDRGNDILGVAFGNTVGEKTRIQGEKGEDFISAGSQFGAAGVFGDRFWAHSGSDDDVMSICGGSVYGEDLRLIGGREDDFDLLALQDPNPVVNDGIKIKRFEVEVQDDPIVADKFFELKAAIDALLIDNPMYEPLDADYFLCGEFEPPSDQDTQTNDVSDVLAPFSLPGGPFDVGDSINVTGFVGPGVTESDPDGDLYRVGIAAAVPEDAIVKIVLINNDLNNTLGFGAANPLDTSPVFGIEVAPGETEVVEIPISDFILDLNDIVFGTALIGDSMTSSELSTNYEITATICPPEAGPEDVQGNDLTEFGDFLIATETPLAVDDSATETGFIGPDSQTDVLDASDKIAFEFDDSVPDDAIIKVEITSTDPANSILPRAVGNTSPNASFPFGAGAFSPFNTQIDVGDPTFTAEFTRAELENGTGNNSLQVFFDAVSPNLPIGGNPIANATNYEITVTVCPPEAGPDDVRGNDLSDSGAPSSPDSLDGAAEYETLTAVGDMVMVTGFVETSADASDSVLIPISSGLLSEASGNMVRLTLEATADIPVRFTSITASGMTLGRYDASTATPTNTVSYDINPAIALVDGPIDGLLIRVFPDDEGTAPSSTTTYKITATVVGAGDSRTVDASSASASTAVIDSPITSDVILPPYTGFVGQSSPGVVDTEDLLWYPTAPMTFDGILIDFVNTGNTDLTFVISNSVGTLDTVIVPAGTTAVDVSVLASDYDVDNGFFITVTSTLDESVNSSLATNYSISFEGAF